MAFTVDTEERDGWMVLHLNGELDLGVADRLTVRVGELAEQGHHRLVFDLSGVSFCDSTGVGVLVRSMKRLRSDGGDLRLAAAWGMVAKVLEITRLNDAIGTYDSVNEATAAT